MKSKFRFIGNSPLKPPFSIRMGALATGSVLAGLLLWQGFNPAAAQTRSPAFEGLVAKAAAQSVSVGESYYLVVPQDLFADEKLTKPIGSVEVSTRVKVLETKADAQRVELDLWRKNKGYGRVWYAQFGINVTSAILDKTISRDKAFVQVLESKEEPVTGLEWQRVKATAWMRKGSVIDKIEPIWEMASTTYTTSCSTCHRQTDPSHFDANTWPAQFGGMIGFTSMDKDTGRVVLKYLQMHSSDFAKK